ncbi:hypothetical protein DFH09DRAFT_1276780 [Mycena vulgaris]|nr:hypothetical protein DFH09DRAFT_1276780 [Mycena vulgaris]
MSTEGLKICPHTCGCDSSPAALAIMARTPEWLGRCPVYAPAGTGMTSHLVRELHSECKPPCSAYNLGLCLGRDLTPQELTAWVPYIGHLDQFRAYIPAEYQYLVISGGLNPAFLPHHPLFPPRDAPSTAQAAPVIPARYDEFFASIGKAPSKPEFAKRVALGSLLQDTSNRTYEDFFGTYGGLRATPIEPSPGIHASSSSADLMERERLLLAALNKRSSLLPQRSGIDDYTSPSLPDPLPQSYDAFFANSGSSNAASSSSVPWTPLPTSFRTAPPPREPGPPRRKRASPRASTPPPPPPPPPRDLAVFQRILAATSPETLRATLLAAHTTLPAAAELFWAHLSTLATAPDGVAHLVARYQRCRHCAEEFDTADPGARCTWHHGEYSCTTLLDPGAVQWGTDPEALYFWDCCGARLSARAPGCVVTAHAPLTPPDGAPMRLAAPLDADVDAEPPGKRKRVREPTVRCGHCAAAFHENDDTRCRWHDGVQVFAEGAGRWACCGQDGGAGAVGCVNEDVYPSESSTQNQPCRNTHSTSFSRNIAGEELTERFNVTKLVRNASGFAEIHERALPSYALHECAAVVPRKLERRRDGINDPKTSVGPDSKAADEFKSHILSVTGYLATYAFLVLYRSLIMSWEHLPGLDEKAWVLRTRLDHLAEFWLSCNGWVNFLRSHPKNSHFRVSWPPASGRCSGSISLRRRAT